MAHLRSRVVELAEPRARAFAQNPRTVCLSSVTDVPRHADFHALFLAHYPRIRSTCLEFAEPGVAVFACSIASGQWIGTMCLAARPGELRAGVIGRHTAAELFLDGQPTLALRHLLVVLEPVPLRDALRGDVRFRVMDLETGCPPVTEEGKAVAALTAEGPVLLTCQGFALMAFVTGDDSDWPERAEDAWACVPERVFVEERMAQVADGSAPRRLPSSPGSDRVGRSTLVCTHAGPAHIAARPLCIDEPVHGELRIDTVARSETIRVGRESLRRGVLIGRYERCHGAVSDARISRVHLMLVELAGRPCVIDLSSSNGTFLVDAGRAGDALRAALLEDGQPVGLAGVATVVSFTAAAASDR